MDKIDNFIKPPPLIIDDTIEEIPIIKKNPNQKFFKFSQKALRPLQNLSNFEEEKSKNHVPIKHTLSDKINSKLSQELDPIKIGISTNYIKFINNCETSLFYYNNGKMYIVITNYGLLKINNNKLKKYVYLDQIQYINHIKNNIFKSDKINIVDNNLKITQFGIYSKKICQKFYNLLRHMLRI